MRFVFLGFKNIIIIDICDWFYLVNFLKGIFYFWVKKYIFVFKVEF